MNILNGCYDSFAEIGFSLRNWLFTTATKSDRFAGGVDVHADALIIDLEDTVARATKQMPAPGTHRPSPAL